MDLATFAAGLAAEIDAATGTDIGTRAAAQFRMPDAAEVAEPQVEHVFGLLAQMMLPERDAPPPLPDRSPQGAALGMVAVLQAMIPYADPRRRLTPEAWQEDQGLRDTFSILCGQFLELLLSEALGRRMTRMSELWGRVMLVPDGVLRIAAMLEGRSDEQQKLLAALLVDEVMVQGAAAGPLPQDERTIRWGQHLFDPLNVLELARGLRACRPTDRPRTLARIAQLVTAMEPPVEPERFAAVVRRCTAD